MQRNVVTGSTKLQVSYPDVFTLMEHLALMGEGTASINRQYNVGSETFLSMASIYQGEVFDFQDTHLRMTCYLLKDALTSEITYEQYSYYTYLPICIRL